MKNRSKPVSRFAPPLIFYSPSASLYLFILQQRSVVQPCLAPQPSGDNGQQTFLDRPEPLGLADLLFGQILRAGEVGKVRSLEAANLGKAPPRLREGFQHGFRPLFPQQAQGKHLAVDEGAAVLPPQLSRTPRGSRPARGRTACRPLAAERPLLRPPETPAGYRVRSPHQDVFLVQQGGSCAVPLSSIGEIPDLRHILFRLEALTERADDLRRVAFALGRVAPLITVRRIETPPRLLPWGTPLSPPKFSANRSIQ